MEEDWNRTLNPILWLKELGGDTFDINGRAVNALYKRVEEGHLPI